MNKKCRDVVAREVEAAKKLLGDGKKPQALLALKKKKYQEGLIEKSEGQLTNLEQMVFLKIGSFLDRFYRICSNRSQSFRKLESRKRNIERN